MIMRTIKVEACVASLRTLSISEVNYLADRLVELDPGVENVTLEELQEVEDILFDLIAAKNTPYETFETPQ